MKKEQQQVREFMLKAGQECPNSPDLVNISIRELRLRLINEELNELYIALKHEDKIEVYDAILDLLVVTIGAANAFGMDLEPGWNEVMRSNMTKFIDGHKREDGKWIKGPSYSPANLKPILDAQSTQDTQQCFKL